MQDLNLLSLTHTSNSPLGKKTHIDWYLYHIITIFTVSPCDSSNYVLGESWVGIKNEWIELRNILHITYFKNKPTKRNFPFFYPRSKEGALPSLALSPTGHGLTELH